MAMPMQVPKQDDKKIRKVQNIIVENRMRATISGVLDVDSFDETGIVLYTEQGLLTIRGEELHISKLSVEVGEVYIEGQIDSFFYSMGDGKKTGSLFSKIFK